MGHDRRRLASRWVLPAVLSAALLGCGDDGEDDDNDSDHEQSGASSGDDFAADAKQVQLEVFDLKIEINDTDGDSGFQIFLDAEAGYEWLKVFDPKGTEVFHVSGGGSVGKTGLTELYFESAEPGFEDLPLEDFLKRFPEGVYTALGKGLDGSKLVGEDTLTHAIPEGPQLLSPEDGSVQDPAHTRVVWEPVPDPKGSSIVAYQAIVEQEQPVLRVLDVTLPPTADSLSVPPEYLQPGIDYKFEVLAIEESGNQTLNEATFSTAAAGERPPTAREPGASGDPPASCGADPNPPGGTECPTECTGGCTDGHLCQIDCSASKGCENKTITCPPDYDCEVICTSLDSCDTAMVQCPADYGCSLVCATTDGCGDLTFKCSNGPCAIHCEDAEACTGAGMECGDGACTAMCGDGATAPAVTCGSACGCTPCP
jgi:hypothetical protein